ncbi:PAAR domain-containing protein [Atlantibacter hermannii]|uniref:PAAR domain-containing protein n=1 Tax=Atlantibacter hermannii TaxID=565 RepID=UPI0013EEF2CD|nr:PAAR domain-containing protein [Atlantibacter hermannii]MDU7388372.1 PAAR domain-containing protein [Atlantibacter hermannii]WIF59424.1 PAAR domain-containing protein [Atlantibacter hermannii]
MTRTICVGDKTSHGGVVMTGSSQIFIDDRAVARKSDKVSCPEHGDNIIIEGDENHDDNGLPVALENGHCACGAVLISSGSRVIKE